MKFGSLFSGIGGFDLGLERAGMECSWQVEIDDYCLKVLEKHWPDVRRYKDVKELHGVLAHTESEQDRRIQLSRFQSDIRTSSENNKSCPSCLPAVDLICGGFPCQPYSVAGKRRGAEDDRNLWPEFLRIVRELRPAWVVGENVPGIVPMYLDTVLADLEGEAYTCWTFNIPACAFDAPHRRERIFVVGYTEKLGRDEGQAEKSGGYKGSQESPRGSGGIVSNASIERERRLHLRPGRSQQATVDVDRSGEDVAYAKYKGRGQMANSASRKAHDEPERGGRWTVEPELGRVAHGIPHRVDRLRSLGNAVVPQVVEFIGRRIVETS